MTTSSQRVVVSLDSFKGTTTAIAASRSLASGWRAMRPADEVVVLPMADGGEGTADVLEALTPGARRHPVEVTGPDGTRTRTTWLALPDGTAVVETATTCGYAMSSRTRATEATSAGLGEALVAAVRHPGVERVLVALGGSATTDGGRGALLALGARVTDDGVDRSTMLRPPAGGVVCLTDVIAPLLGELGAARQFAPQKGASPAEVEVLEERLTRWSVLLGGRPDQPGAGAAGGIGYALATAWQAALHDGGSYVAERIGLDAELAAADVVVTGEGCFDHQSLQGKVVGHVLHRAGEHGTRPMLACGRLDPGAPNVFAPGDVAELTSLAGSSRAAMADPERWLAAAGRVLAGHRPAAGVRRSAP